MSEFWTFAFVGFVAQLIDGTLGMGFGVISSTVLIGQGYAPALVSASVNAAKIPTTGTAAFSHWYNKNLDPTIVIPLILFGCIGGVVGMLLLTSLKGQALQYLITAYLLFIGALILWRGMSGKAPRLIPAAYKRLVGLAGGLIEGIGGSWGPIVTTSLLGSGNDPRYSIGSSNFSEFFVSIAVFSAYAAAFFAGHWSEGGNWMTMLAPVAGLVLGGLPAALAGGYLARISPSRLLMSAVGLLSVGVGIFRLFTV